MNEPEYLRFTPDDLAEVLAALARLRELGQGWINITPSVPPEVAVPSAPGPLAIFSKQGPPLPMATWTAPELTRSGIGPAQIGVLHPAGRRIAPELRDSAPEGLVLEQDHPRRGLVARVAATVDDRALLRWLIDVLARFNRVPTDGAYVATVHRPRGAR